MTTVEFEAAVLENKDRVYSYARGLLRDPEEAKDIAQETLIRLWRHRERVEPGPGCRSWLFRSAHNLCVDRLRRRSSSPESFGDESDVESADFRPGPERLTSSDEVGSRLQRALMTLGGR